MADSQISERIPELDGLRGIAISLVLIIHYFYFDPYAGVRHAGLRHSLYVLIQRCMGMGWTGVDLFFVLSGFLIGGILLDVRSSPGYFKTFYLRRAHRILPLYYGWILVYVVVMGVGAFLRAQFAAGDAPLSRHQLIALFLFLQNFGVIDYSPVSQAWFQPTWSLAVEEQFYLLAPFIVHVLPRRALYVFLTTIVVTAPFLRVWAHDHLPRGGGGLDLAYTLTPCRADALALGILAALLWRNDQFRERMANHPRILYGIFAVLLAGFALLAKVSPSYDSAPMLSVGYTCIALFYAVALLLALSRPAGPIAAVARTQWLRKLGRISYCLYMIHLAVSLMLQIVFRLRVNPPEFWPLIRCNIVAVICCYALASASWRYFEYPLLRRGHVYRF